jgi:hypothetical protein
MGLAAYDQNGESGLLESPTVLMDFHVLAGNADGEE